jgi:site-specific DNA-methyltransferase (adenine-specific)
VGKSYEKYLKSYVEWRDMLEEVVRLHFPIVRPGGFLVINIADVLCFADAKMPRIQAETINQRRSVVTREDVLRAKIKFPAYNRDQLAVALGCSEQTVDRRLNGNNIRGGKYKTQTRVKLVAGTVERWARRAGFYIYDRRIWAKDPAWQNSEWHSSSYRAVDEFEYLYFLWKPGSTTVDRKRLSPLEWAKWGSRAVWHFPSVRSNNDHEAKFPLELPRRVIRLLTARGDTVLDCFMGSGSTAVAAIESERQYIGIELLPEYVALARSACFQAARSKQKPLLDQDECSEPATQPMLLDVGS